MVSFTERNKMICDLYLSDHTYAEIFERTGVSKGRVMAILRGAGIPRDRRSNLRSTLQELAMHGDVTLDELAVRTGADRRVVEQTLHYLRKHGQIAAMDGMTVKDGPKTSALTLRLDRATRRLLDGEAADEETTPSLVAQQILEAVLNNQELLEAALAA